MLKTIKLDFQKVLLTFSIGLLILYIGSWIMQGMGWTNLESFQTDVVAIVPASTPTTTTLTFTPASSADPTSETSTTVPGDTIMPPGVVISADPARGEGVTSAVGATGPALGEIGPAQGATGPSDNLLLLPSIDSYITLDEAQRKKFFIEINKKLEVSQACAGNSVCQDSVRAKLPVSPEILSLFDYLLNIREQQQVPLTYEEFDGLMKMIVNGDIILSQ